MVDQYIDPVLSYVISWDNWLFMNPTVSIHHIDDAVTSVNTRQLEAIADLLSSLHTAEEWGGDDTGDVLSVR